MTAYSIVVGLDTTAEAIDDMNAGLPEHLRLPLDVLGWSSDHLRIFLSHDLDHAASVESIEVTP